MTAKVHEEAIFRSSCNEEELALEMYAVLNEGVSPASFFAPADSPHVAPKP